MPSKSWGREVDSPDSAVEREFYREVAGTGGLPEYVKALLKQERVCCFLGYPLDDPDSLLGLQTDVLVAGDFGGGSHRGTKSSPGGAVGNAVGDVQAERLGWGVSERTDWEHRYSRNSA